MSHNNITHARSYWRSEGVVRSAYQVTKATSQVAIMQLDIQGLEDYIVGIVCEPTTAVVYIANPAQESSRMRAE